MSCCLFTRGVRIVVVGTIHDFVTVELNGQTDPHLVILLGSDRRKSGVQGPENNYIIFQLV